MTPTISGASGHVPGRLIEVHDRCALCKTGPAPQTVKAWPIQEEEAFGRGRRNF
ncbi:MAG TPA: hypothetical protein PKA03_02890 [Tabrizicola sp.]|nr:hypothetical protein [Tabrizicola sp.]